MSKVKVLIVDDSATMRAMIRQALRQDGDIEVVGEAGDPLEARSAIKALNPDVITLDVEMPNMDGIEFLERLMRLRPMPVIMVSTLTQRGADISLRALELGAFDCVGKPLGVSSGGGFAHLPALVRAAADARVRGPSDAAHAAPPARYAPGDHVIAIGSSTGGVEALQAVLSSFPDRCPPTVITQHMPPLFTRSFAMRLDRLCAPHIEEATDGALLAPGHVYLAPGGAAHLEVVASSGGLRCRVREGEPVNGHRPSVDVLFDSVAQVIGARAVGVILTGMGRDGAAGMRRMRDAGAHTIGQNEATCVVFGMPKVAAELGGVERQLPLGAIAHAALDMCAATMRGAA